MPDEILGIAELITDLASGAVEALTWLPDGTVDDTVAPGDRKDPSAPSDRAQIVWGENADRG